MTASTIPFDKLPNNGYVRKGHITPDVVLFSSATFRRKCKAEQFPKPVKLSERVTSIRLGEIRQFLAEQLQSKV